MVTYDIEDDKRRNKAHKALKDFGIPVQLSVFECMLDKGDYQKMKKKVRSIIKKGDGVRFYRLCEACDKRTTLSGTGYILKEEDFYIV